MYFFKSWKYIYKTETIYDMKILKYLLSGSLQNMFANPDVGYLTALSPWLTHLPGGSDIK